MLTRDFDVNGSKVRVLQKLELGHAGTVWDGALVLLGYLNKHPLQAEKLFKGKVALQLGAGTGIVGLACNFFNLSTLILTDFPENLKLLQENRQLNFPQTKNVVVTDLSWGDEKSMGDIAKHSKVDVIVGSELAYDADNIRLLLSTIDYFKQINPSLTTIISYTRYPQPHKNLKTYLEGRPHREVSPSEMDSCYRDQSIGIVILE